MTDHLRHFNFLALPKFGKYKKYQNYSTHFPLNMEFWMYRTPLTLYEQENLSHQTQLEGFFRALKFLRLLPTEAGSQRYCTSVLQAGTRVHKNPKSALFGST